MMKKVLLIVSILFSTAFSYAQYMDLIVTSSNDSIACQIISEDEDKVSFFGRLNGSSIESHIAKSEINDLKYDAVYRKDISRIPGTFFFHTKAADLRPVNRNSLYATAGFLGFFAQALIDYEYILSYNADKLFPAVFIKGGLGLNALYISGISFKNTLGTYTGSKNSHFEVSAGYFILPAESLIWPTGSIAYRYQKPKGNFIFRTGFGYPEGIFLSFGTAF